MHDRTIEQWQHSHNFSVNRETEEKKTKIVILLTAITMIVEIFAGWFFGSIALLADGWHMATHVAAFGITIFTYQYARKQAQNFQYTFGTGKVNVLGGFASAVALGVIAFVMALESGIRFFQPQTIQFNQAIIVAIIGLIVNLISALLLKDDDHHHHDQAHHHHHHDRNLRAAYFHVLADALTSVLAILALFAGKFLGWIWLDATMGLVGAVIITKWSYDLVRETSSILLDSAVDKQIKLDILNAIEAHSDNRITDLHVWYISENHLSATISVVTHYPQQPEYYKQLLSHIDLLSPLVVEVNQCHGEPCLKV